MYDYDDIERMVKTFVYQQYEEAKKNPDSAFHLRGIAYGAVQFATNYLFPCFNHDLNDWWANEMWSKFTDLIS